MKIQNVELVRASDHEEFFYVDSNDPVYEGDPVGIEWQEKDDSPFDFPPEEVFFTLFNNIYWKPQDEEG
jgi:hypothetical protein